MLYYEILLVIVFVMQSIEHFLCNGKRILAMCLGLELFDRQPAMLYSKFRLERVASYSEMLGPWPE